MTERAITLREHPGVIQPPSRLDRCIAWLEGADVKIDIDISEYAMIAANVIAIVCGIVAIASLITLYHWRNSIMFQVGNYCEFKDGGSTTWVKCDYLRYVNEAKWNGLRQAWSNEETERLRKDKSYNYMEGKRLELLAAQVAGKLPASK